MAGTISTADSLKFVPKTNYNNSTGFDSLKLLLVDDSTADAANGNPALPANSGDRVTGLNDAQGKGGNTRYSNDAVTIKITVNPVNDAPKVVNGTTETLAAITEDTFAPAGETVKNLFNNGSKNHFNDQDDNSDSSTANNFAGVLITGHEHNANLGYWQYSIDGGTNWINLSDKGILSDSKALFLNADAKLRFAPQANWSGTPGTLTVRLVDDSASNGNPDHLNPGLPGNNTLTNVDGKVGGVTRYSDKAITLSTVVVEVNNAPKVNDPHIAVNMAPINEDYAPSANQGGQLVKDLFSSRFDDSLDGLGNSVANEMAGILVKNISTPASQGKWQYWNGNSWANLDNGMFVRDTDNIRFAPALDFNKPADVTGLSVYLVEKSGSTFFPYNQADYPASGTHITYNYDKNGAFSQDALDVRIKVNAVNDAPVTQNPLSPVKMTDITEDAGHNSSGALPNKGQTVNELFNGAAPYNLFSDSKDAVTGGSNANDFAGIVIRNVTQDAAKGLWQYSTNNGNSWTDLANGMFIKGSDSIRFMPAGNWNSTTVVNGLDVSLVETGGSLKAENLTSGAMVTYNYTTDGSFSKDSLNVQIKVNPVNDAPLWNPDVFSDVFNTNTNAHFIKYGTIIPAYEADGTTVIGDSNILERTVSQAISKSGISGFSDPVDQIEGGSKSDSLRGILVSGIAGNANLGTWQYKDAANNWINISAAENSALFLAANTSIRFVYNPAYNIAPGVMPHCGLKAAVVDNSTASAGWATGDVKDLSIAANRGGITAVSQESIPLWVAVLPKNYYPEIVNLPPTLGPINERNTTPLALAGNTIIVQDDNLDHSNSTGHWKDSIISIQRKGGAKAEDTFVSLNTNLLRFSDGKFYYNNQLYGDVKNSDGNFELKFTRNNTLAGEVSDILKLVGYQNTSYDPDPEITLQWKIDDGNYGANNIYPQGSNHGNDPTGFNVYNQTIIINPINDRPVANNDQAEIKLSQAEASGNTITGNVMTNDYDVDRIKTPIAVADYDKGIYGTLTIKPDGSYTYVLNENALSSIIPGQSVTETIKYRIYDGELYAEAHLQITIHNDKPPVVITDDKPSQHVPDPITVQPIGDHEQNLATPKPQVEAVVEARESLANSVNNRIGALDTAIKRLWGDKDNLAKPDLAIHGKIGDQTIYTGFSQTIQVPKDLFQHSNPNERLSYMVTMADGRPLPPWLTWTGDTLTFIGKPRLGEGGLLVIKITAMDQNGHQATAIFNLNVLETTDKNPASEQKTTVGPDGKPVVVQTEGEGNNDLPPLISAPSDEGADSPAADQLDENAQNNIPVSDNQFNFDNVGALAFSEQVALNGQQGIFDKAREFLRHLYILV